MARVLITGASRGIGLALTRGCRARGDEVIAICRSASAELEKTGARVVSGVDVADPSEMRRVSEALSGQTLDLLVHNAGIYASTALGMLDAESIRAEFEINALSPLLWTEALRTNLQQGSRVVLITSRAGSIAGNVEGGGYGYRMSKAALNMAGVGLARDLSRQGVAVLMLSPGTVLTDMVREAFERAQIPPGSIPSAEDVAPQLLSRMDELSLENTGRFLGREGEIIPW